MKANEAPEKIYITNFDIEALPKDEQLSEHWHEVSTQDTDIEYTRTDAFIEYLRKWVASHNENDYYTFGYISKHLDDFIDDFKNYMKGE